jgi:hypothetical protein
MPLVYTLFLCNKSLSKNAISKVREYQKGIKSDADDVNLLGQNINNVKSTLKIISKGACLEVSAAEKVEYMFMFC